MSSAAPMPRSARVYLSLVSAASGVGVGLCAALLLQAPAPLLPTLAVALALSGAVFLTQRRGFVLHWSGQRTVVTIDEPAVMLSLLLLPIGWTPLVVLAAVALCQKVARRPLVKAVYNTTAYALGACIATLAYAGLLALHVPPLAAGAVAVIAYTLGTTLTVSGLFARLESGRTIPIFLQRFGRTAPVHASLGAASVVVAYALWALHPVAVLALAPFLVMGLRFVRMDALSQREVHVRARLADMTAALGIRSREPDVAERVLDTCGDLFFAGRAALTLDAAGAREPRAWQRDFEGGPEDGAGALSAPLLARDGSALGTLSIWPAQRARRMQSTHVDARLLAVVAGQAASAIEATRALEEFIELTRLNESIIGHAPAGILAVDARGRITQLNTHLLRALGVDDDPRGEPVAEWAPLAGHPALVDAMRALQAGVPFYDVEIPPAFHGGPALSASGVALEGERGSVILVSDVSAHKRAEEALRGQMLARPFVRRLVLSIVTRLNAPRADVADVGRALAAELGLATPEEYSAAFRGMGLGNLVFESQDGESYHFAADDLLERHPRSSQPTCHLALGYVEGVVAHLRGTGSLGTEVRCQSQGHTRCRFVVKPRPKATVPKRLAVKR